MHRIPLASFAWLRTEPRLELHPSTINLFLPTRLGDLPWMFERDQIAVVDTRDPIAVVGARFDGADGSLSDLGLSTLNVPYLATTTAAAPPTSGLLFARPKHHPVLGTLDGFLIREERPGQLVELAVALGIETANDLTWFADHRRPTPPSVASVRSTIRRVENAGVASAAAGGGLFFLAAGQSAHHRTGRLGLALLVGGAAIAVVTDWIGRHRHSDDVGFEHAVAPGGESVGAGRSHVGS